MSDLIERDRAIAVIDRCKHRLQGQGSTYEIMLDMIKTIPSAEPTWTSVLAELHERFDALEKEIRRASAEMSAVIRANTDRPKGEWMPYEAYLGKDREYSVTEHKCSLCGYLWGEPEYRYCPNCGADMRGERADEHGRNKSADRQ